MIIYNTQPNVLDTVINVVPGDPALPPDSGQLICIETSSTTIITTESGVYLEA